MNRGYTILPVIALLLTLAPGSLTSNTWYVNAVQLFLMTFNRSQAKKQALATPFIRLA